MNVRSARLVSAAFGMVACAALTIADRPAKAADEAGAIIDAPGLRVTLGEQVTILKDGSFGLHYFPDEGTSSIGTPGHVKLAIAAEVNSYLLEGPDLLHLNSAKRVMTPGPKGSFENGYVGIGSVYADKGGKLYAYYHAEDHEGIPQIGKDLAPGFYASIAVAESGDGGYSWSKLGQVVTSGKPKDFKAFPEHNFRGAASPGVVADRDGRYLYLYYTDMSYVSGGTQICVARADLSAGPPVAGAWLKYNGNAFAEPGIGGKDVPVLNVSSMNQAHSNYPNVTYSVALKKYVMVFSVNQWREPQQNQPAKVSGIYFSLSDDGLNWSKPTELLADYAYPVVGKPGAWQGTVIWDDGDDGRHGWLIYAYTPRFGYPGNGGTPHYMVGRRISLEKTD